MKTVLSLVFVVLAAGCAGQDGPPGANSGMLLTFQCDDGWVDCNRDAIDACGKRRLTKSPATRRAPVPPGDWIVTARDDSTIGLSPPNSSC